MPYDVDLNTFEEQIKDDLYYGNFGKKQIFINICQKVNPSISSEVAENHFNDLSKQGFYKDVFDLISKLYEDEMHFNVNWRLNDGYDWKEIFNYFCVLNDYEAVEGKLILIKIYKILMI